MKRKEVPRLADRHPALFGLRINSSHSFQPSDTSISLRSQVRRVSHRRPSLRCTMRLRRGCLMSAERPLRAGFDDGASTLGHHTCSSGFAEAPSDRTTTCPYHALRTLSAITARCPHAPAGLFALLSHSVRVTSLYLDDFASPRRTGPTTSLSRRLTNSLTGHGLRKIAICGSVIPSGSQCRSSRVPTFALRDSGLLRYFEVCPACSVPLPSCFAHLWFISGFSPYGHFAIFGLSLVSHYFYEYSLLA